MAITLGVFFQAGYTPPTASQPMAVRDIPMVLDVQPITHHAHLSSEKYGKDNRSLEGKVIQSPIGMETYSVLGRTQVHLETGFNLDIFA